MALNEVNQIFDIKITVVYLVTDTKISKWKLVEVAKM